MEFDLDLAVKQDTENPLYYVQYAHARICSVLHGTHRRAGVALPDTVQTTDLTVLTARRTKRQLIKQVASAARGRFVQAARRAATRPVLNKYAVCNLAAAVPPLLQRLPHQGCRAGSRVTRV